MAYQIVAAIISESKLKKHHKDEFINIHGFRIHRRDRIGRGGGGVATYVANIYSSTFINICGFRIHRRDRIGRGGGGVAIYVANIYSSSFCSLTGDNSEYELLWIRVEGGRDATLIGALYHPPNPV